MRILMSADCVGGVWTYALELTRALRERGDEVVLATMGRALSEEGRRAALAAGPLALAERAFRLEWMEDAWADVEAAGSWLLELEAQHRPDVVHLSSLAHASLRWRAPVLLVAHSDVLSWWRAVRGEEAPPGWDRYRAEGAAGLAAADALVAPTRAALAGLRAFRGAEPERGRVIANASGSPVHPPTTAREPLILAAGRLWDPAKNLGLLDRAAAGLPWEVQVAGELGDERPRHVRPLGPLGAEELRALRERAAIFAAPALYEPFGLAALEAARSGCALVLGDIPSLREVWGGAALFVDPRDASALRRGLRSLIEDPARCARLAAAAQARSRCYEVAPMVDAYRDLYGSLHGSLVVAR